MSLIRPFRALRPAPSRAGEVLAPPYDVLSSAEARARAIGKPWSFLHISKPEIDLDPDIDGHDPAVYAKAAENLGAMIASGILTRDALPHYYAYRLTRAGRVQTGLAAVASVAEYATNRIRKHELTTPAKEDDRVRQIVAVNAQTGPVMMAYPASAAIDAILAGAASGEPEVDVTADDGIRHELWVIREPALVDRLTAAVDRLPSLYIADGHHRSAAAARVSAALNGSGESHRHFLSVIFPHHEMTILGYHRLLSNLGGRTPADLLTALGESFAVDGANRPVEPVAAGEFGLFLDGHWYRLTIRPELVPKNDPVGRLPITLLTRHAIEPLFGILNQRTDKRIDFVGGGRGLGELERRVTSGGAAAAFALYPTTMTDLMAVADAGEIMPPKSTWFEPKLADGMLSHVLD